jgi:hypothetical protein
MLTLNTWQERTDEQASTVEKKEELNRILEAQRTIEKRLTSMEVEFIKTSAIGRIG